MIPEMIKKNIANKMNDSKKNDFYEMEKCSKWIDAHNLNKVCLQFPDNLLSDSVEIALRLENYVNKKVYILGDTSYGSCCVDEIAAQHINADSIIHFGHACLNPTTRLPVFHVLPKQEIDIIEITNKFRLNFIDQFERILFFYDIAYAHKTESIYKILNPIYKNLIFTSLNCTSNVEFTDNKDNSSTIILGRCFKLDKEYKLEDYVAFFLGNDGRTFITLAMTISAKKCVGKINPEKLANFPEIDAFVAITCPENEIFDSREFLKPILMPYEVELAFNISREYYTQYCMDFRQILPGGINYIDFKTSTDSDISLITGNLRNYDENASYINKMNTLVISNTSDIVAIGKAGAEFLNNRSWKGVEQRLGKDAVHAAEIGRYGLPNCYENEPILQKKNDE
ncbi:2-(3-amino-3-carboxypropyl)histidine synthase subunit 2 [Apis mellifera carnica]|nr:2-(3-amino-3-carboxypropyl)histidine synthase subunit 2 [Apis mellifera carnica]